ncbi:MAG: acyl carrier protein [Bryobacteraceae bacterium]
MAETLKKGFWGLVMRHDLIDGLRRLIVEDLFVEIPPEQIGLDDGLRTVVGLDSVGFAELRVRCESRFDVQIDDEDYTPENFSSIHRLADLIDRLQKARRMAAAPAEQ